MACPPAARKVPAKKTRVKGLNTSCMKPTESASHDGNQHWRDSPPYWCSFLSASCVYCLRCDLQVADGSMKLTGALGETTSKAAGAFAAGVTTAMGSTRQKVRLSRCAAHLVGHICVFLNHQTAKHLGVFLVSLQPQVIVTFFSLPHGLNLP
jgi:hypothetical protein